MAKFGQAPLRYSRLAERSRRLGAIAIPFLIVSVFGHYLELYNTEVLLLLLILGSFMGATAIVFAVIALVDLWKEGGKGFANCIWAIAYGTIVLIPLAAATVALYAFPPLNDISTDLQDPPALSAGVRIAPAMDRKLQLMQRASYPDIVPRRFRLPPAELHAAAASVASAMGWETVYELPAGFAEDPTYLVMEARLPFLSVKDDVAIRIQPDEVGTLLDIRSASRFGSHDFGTNARRIRSFLASLDSVLIQNYGITASTPAQEPVLLQFEELEQPQVTPPVSTPQIIFEDVNPWAGENGTTPMPQSKPGQ